MSRDTYSHGFVFLQILGVLGTVFWCWNKGTKRCDNRIIQKSFVLYPKWS